MFPLWLLWYVCVYKYVLYIYTHIYICINIHTQTHTHIFVCIPSRRSWISILSVNEKWIFCSQFTFTAIARLVLTYPMPFVATTLLSSGLMWGLWCQGYGTCSSRDTTSGPVSESSDWTGQHERQWMFSWKSFLFCRWAHKTLPWKWWQRMK